jgi:hypothetical protein
MLTEGLRTGSQTQHIEVLFFAAKSIYDGFDEDNWNSVTLSFISEFFAFVAKEP